LAARFALWTHGAMTLYYAVQPWSGAKAPLASALGALALPALLTATAFFRPTAHSSPFSELAKQRGLSSMSLQLGVAAARAWLVMRPFAVSVPLLWLSALAASGTLAAWFSALLGMLASWVCALGLALCLSALASLSEQLSPTRARRLFWLLVFVPLLLKSAVPELPSVWHGYRAFTQWAAAQMEPV
jgi:hypothetical protein